MRLTFTRRSLGFIVLPGLLLTGCQSTREARTSSSKPQVVYSGIAINPHRDPLGMPGVPITKTQDRNVVGRQLGELLHGAIRWGFVVYRNLCERKALFLSGRQRGDPT